MSESEAPKKSHEKLKHDDEFGIKAKVMRDSVEGEAVREANATLCGIGEFIKAKGPTALRNLNYMGSASFHVYQSEILGQVFFVSQTATLRDTPEQTAADGLRQFSGDLMVAFGRVRPRQRSGI